MPKMFDDAPNQTGAVIGLSVAFSLTFIAAVVFASCCLRFRRKYLEGRVDGAYNAFET